MILLTFWWVVKPYSFISDDVLLVGLLVTGKS